MNGCCAHRDWLIWLGLAGASFAVLEWRGLTTEQPTFSHVMRFHIRTSARRKVAAAMCAAGVSAWLTWHLVFEEAE